MKVQVPAMFIAGKQDWGIYQRPGAINRMQNEVCSRMGEIQLVENAGHWVQQEQPEDVLQHLSDFLAALD